MSNKTVNRWTWVLAVVGMLMLFAAGNVQAQGWQPEVPPVIMTRHAQAQEAASNAGATVQAAAATAGNINANQTRIAHGASTVQAHANNAQATVQSAVGTAQAADRSAVGASAVSAQATVKAYAGNMVATAHKAVATRVPQVPTAVPSGRGARVWRCWENRWGVSRCQWMIKTGR